MQSYVGSFSEKKLEQELHSLNLRTSARNYDDGRTRIYPNVFRTLLTGNW